MATKEENSARQKRFLQSVKDKGYVVLSSVYVPAVIRDEIRAMVKAAVTRWEESQSKF